MQTMCWMRKKIYMETNKKLEWYKQNQSLKTNMNIKSNLKLFPTCLLIQHIPLALYYLCIFPFFSKSFHLTNYNKNSAFNASRAHRTKLLSLVRRLIPQ